MHPGDLVAGPPEWRALLALLRMQFSSPKEQLWQQLPSQTTGWEPLLQMAHAHAVLPLVCWQLLGLETDALPGPLREQLGAWLQAHTQRNLRMAGQLFELLALLAAHGIPALPFKGPCLAAQAYHNVALRHFLDLDLLVPQKRLTAAGTLLRDRGFVPQFPLSQAQERSYLRSIGQLPLINHERDLLVELHVTFTPKAFSFAIDHGQVWQRREAVTVAGRDVLTLAPEDHFLVLCAHGTKHLWRTLANVCDVGQMLLRYPDMNWEQLLAQARRLGAQRMVCLALSLTRSLLGMPLPDVGVRGIARDRAVPALAATICRELPCGPGKPCPGLTSALFSFRARERFHDGLTYALALALEPTVRDWTALALPEMLEFLYYPFRPLRWLAQAGACTVQATKKAMNINDH